MVPVVLQIMSLLLAWRRMPTRLITAPSTTVMDHQTEHHRQMEHFPYKYRCTVDLIVKKIVQLSLSCGLHIKPKMGVIPSDLMKLQSKHCENQSFCMYLGENSQLCNCSLSISFFFCRSIFYDVCKMPLLFITE